MDYKNLLKKYIEHVMNCEGVTFIGGVDFAINEVGFTDEEKEILESLDL